MSVDDPIPQQIRNSVQISEFRLGRGLIFPEDFFINLSTIDQDMVGGIDTYLNGASLDLDHGDLRLPVDKNTLPQFPGQNKHADSFEISNLRFEI